MFACSNGHFEVARLLLQARKGRKEARTTTSLPQTSRLLRTRNRYEALQVESSSADDSADPDSADSDSAESAEQVARRMQ